MIGGDGSDCGGHDAFIHGGEGGGGDFVGPGHTEHPNPVDERPKINGEPTSDQSHELVIKKNHAED